MQLKFLEAAEDTHRELYLAILSSVLRGMFVVSFDEVTLELGYGCYKPSFMYDVHNDRGGIKSLWKAIDEGISDLNSGALTQIEWERYWHYAEKIKDKPLYSDCVRSLYCELLPELATRDLLDECDGECCFHKCV